MKRILIRPNPDQEQYVWVNHPEEMSYVQIKESLDKLYGKNWKRILVEHSVTLRFQ